MVAEGAIAWEFRWANTMGRQEHVGGSIMSPAHWGVRSLGRGDGGPAVHWGIRNVVGLMIRPTNALGFRTRIRVNGMPNECTEASGHVVEANSQVWGV